MDDVIAYVKGLLEDHSILNLTGDKTIHYIHAASPKPSYVEYEFYNDEGALYEEGQEITTSYYLQVDIFSLDAENGNFKNLITAINTKLVSAGFAKIPGNGDLYEPDTQLYHKPLRFKFDLNN